MDRKILKVCRRAAALALAIAVAAPTMGGVKAEYKFNGWVLDGNEAKLYQKGAQVPITKDLGNGSSTHTFKAKWEHLYTVVIDCNGGTITPGTGWTADGAGRYKKAGLEGNSQQSLPSNEPTLDGYEFAGWQIEGHAGRTYAKGESFSVDPSLASGYVITFKAVWEKAFDAKYAVSIYGIMQDTTQDGKKAALTFGPATGDAVAFMSCRSQNCIHNMTWSQIIAQANNDPTVFQSCLENGCTKSVELNFGDSPLKGTVYPNMAGDGCSILYDSINKSYRGWNNTGDATGGWPASRIRATLNGKDGQTNPSVAGNDCLDTADALISAFPDELKNGGVVAKAVRSDTVYNDWTSGNVTTYDKLWLFSAAEIYQDVGTRNEDIRPHEGVGGAAVPYDRAVKLGITTEEYGRNTGCDEHYSLLNSWWLRSLDKDDYRRVKCVDGNTMSSDGVMNAAGGVCGDFYAGYVTFGLSPGFCVGSR